jgi:formimidoylglutamate deiminase
MEPALKYFRFDALLLQQGWLRPGYVGVNADGKIKYLSDQPAPEAFAVEIVRGIALPGFSNAHSHAFQFGMAGMAEKHQPGSLDDFWTWREAMYECAMTMDPDHIESVAAMLFMEMLRNGITQVTEFHYVHHDFNGKPYANLAETGERIISAARTAGIAITLVPVFYQRGGFDRDPQVRQCRFISRTTDHYLDLLDATASMVRGYNHARLGFGVHSLRAVTTNDIFRTVESGPKDLPFHTHAAEQLREVEECKAFLNRRPVEWLLDNLPLTDRFNLVHCTHLTDDEVVRLAKSRANVVLCPSTEGNLGDGIFRLREFANHYGNWCIGTDSQINLNPLEDLRWLDYSQRVTSHRRNTFDDAATELINKAVMCGRAAAGDPRQNFFELDRSLDAVVYDSSSPTLHQSMKEYLLQALVYTVGTYDIVGTIVNGSWVVRGKESKNGDDITRRFRHAIRDLSQ